MSRIRDALRRAESWQQPERSMPRVALLFASKQPPVPAQVAPYIEWLAPEQALYEEVETPVVAESVFSVKWLLNRFRGRSDLETSAPVALCVRQTPEGQPCRGPAMANGLCRLHGGTRNVRNFIVPETFAHRV